MKRLQTTVILAMSVDGKIADRSGMAARFASPTDQAHLESLIALMDGVLFGASTLRAYQTTLPITNPQLLQQRQANTQPPQPVHIVCSASGNINPELRFFRQQVPRWLLTTPQGGELCKNHLFDKILVSSSPTAKIDWVWAFQQFGQWGFKKLGILGGGELIASLLEADLIDEFYLTLCPLILGGKSAPTPVDGLGLPADQALKLELLEMKAVGSEIFLHYRRKRDGLF